MKNRITKNFKHHDFWAFNFSILHIASQKFCWTVVVFILLRLLPWASSDEETRVKKWEKIISNLSTYATCVPADYINLTSDSDGH
jgi:hypothetical protein